MGTSAATAAWTSLGPTAVTTAEFGLVTGRVSALALDPEDATGSHLYVGTTGGGVWMAQNAATSSASAVTFTSLTDSLAALGGVTDASISIGALTVQPGGSGVILAGTGDPNDVLDSYYGAGILRSTDGGVTWSLISRTTDAEEGLGFEDFSFLGEGFAGFAWSTANPQVVVAAVSQAYEGALVNAVHSGSSCQGIYYSTDSGATWHLATITDSTGSDVQGPLDAFATPDGNAATSVVWNPKRQLFIAAVRFHGYYQSADGVTWTRIAAQPGSGLTAGLCPARSGYTGSVACPIFRGTLAVNPVTGDTFAWTVDLNNQDQGIWQDQCAVSGNACGNACGNTAITFGKQWSTAALETSGTGGSKTIVNGSYTLALAAVPSGQDTLLLAGDEDLWKCSLYTDCVWRNTTNIVACPASNAKVGAFQHALAWNASNPQEILVGNDSGLWRSMDAIGESGQVCSADDATHFQNLNGNLGSLAEVVSLSPVLTTPYTLMAGLGENGTAGVKSTALTTDWPQALSGYGGPVAIDPANTNNWYVNSAPGVSIYKCSQASECTAADFGTAPVVTDADVAGDGYVMSEPAPFLVDPLDSSQLLVGTCRVWRGPADGSSWTSSNAISSILDSGVTSGACSGDALIRTMDAMKLASGGEVVYLGMYGSASNGSNLPGHVLRAIVDPSSSTAPVWTDLTLNPVSNDSNTLNVYGMDISSIYIDPHDATGATVYVTVEGVTSMSKQVKVLYRSTDGGANWANLTANLPAAPANSVVVDPQDASTVYVATDAGVYFTTAVASCAASPYVCWSAFGTGLPEAPAVALSAAPSGASPQVLVAATYGRGIWQTSLWTASDTGLTQATVTPASLVFGSQAFNSTSSAQTVTLQNVGSVALAPTAIDMSGDFSETDNCKNTTMAAGASCTINVTFTPTETGSRTGQMTIHANVYGGQFTVDLSGTGSAAGSVILTPTSYDFGLVAVNSTSSPVQFQAGNSGATAVPITSVAVTSPFTISSNACGTTSLAANADCQVMVAFAPTATGPVTGTLTFTDGAGIQTVQLSGTGGAAPTDVLNPTTLSFPDTATGALSSTQTVALTNTGDLPLKSISISASACFQASNNCGTQLAAHSACAITVAFNPTQVGAQTGTLTVADALQTQTGSLSGTGVAPPAFSVFPASLTFSNVLVGVASAPQAVTVANSGGAPMANVGFQITGAAAASYSLGATTCGAKLANGSSCTVPVTFTPAATGSIAAALAISSSTAGVAAVSVPLNGLGQVTDGLSSASSQLSFSTIGVGLTSAAQTVTVTNTSAYAVGSIVFTATAPFSVSQSTCPGSLAVGASCTAAVTFAPTVAGVATGALTITSNAVVASSVVTLLGTGFDFTAAADGTSVKTISSGQTADYTLTIAPTNGVTGTFTFACSSLPSNSLCLFNPSSQTVSAGATGYVVVQIATGQSTTARADTPAGWRMMPLACGLVLLPLALVRRRRKFLLMAVLLAFTVGGVSSCTSAGLSTSGGTGGSSNGSGTPAGTYPITVTVSSTGISHTVSLSLTVD
jgi:hypothetical protein